MTRPQNMISPSEPSMRSWEDDGGFVPFGLATDDLNSLLAQEQTSIMNAEAAETSASYEFHRGASIHARWLVNTTSYPEHQPFVFAQDRSSAKAEHDTELRVLIDNVERNEALLIEQFGAGKLSERSLQSRARFVRQDRARLVAALDGGSLGIGREHTSLEPTHRP